MKRAARFPQMEIDMYRWVLEKRELGLEVNDTDIRKRAAEIVSDDKFKASKGWCYKFRKRFRLVRRAVTHTSRKMTFTEEDVVRITERSLTVSSLNFVYLYRRNICSSICSSKTTYTTEEFH